MHTAGKALMSAAAAALAASTAQAWDEPTSYEFKVRTKTARVEIVSPDGGGQRLRVTILSPGIPVQDINCDLLDIALFLGTSRIGFESCDYDQDGFTDFSLLDSSSSASNFIRHYFFWSPQRRGFYLRNDVKESGVSVYDPRTRIFSRNWKMSASSGSLSLFAFRRGRLVVLKEMWWDFGQHLRDVIPHADEWEEYLVTRVHRSGGGFRTYYKVRAP